MEVEVRCYGDVRSAVGESSIQLELPPDATVAELLATVAETTEYDPDGVRSGRELVVMRERRHLDADDSLADGDVIGLSESPMPE